MTTKRKSLGNVVTFSIPEKMDVCTQDRKLIFRTNRYIRLLILILNLNGQN